MATIHRKRLLSVLFGVGSAVVIGLIGPLAGGLILLLAFPLVFRTTSRVRVASLLAAFGTSWVILVGTGTGPYVRNMLTLDNGGLLAAMCVVPLMLAGGIVAVARVRPGTPSTNGSQPS